MNALLSAGLGYAARGWRVFPCRPRGKEPLTGHGHRDATTDPTTIRGWWGRWPNANIGVACEPSGLLVLDVDPRTGSDLALSALLQEHGPLPDTVTCVTGGGGTHYYFRNPGGGVVGSLGDGLDVKSAGYVIAPPSVHPAGPAYEWEVSGHPEDEAVAEMPAWLLGLVRGSDRDNGHKRAEPLPAVIHEGEGRNRAMHSVASSLRNRGLTGAEILEALRPINQSRCRPPLDDDELGRLAYSAGRYEAGELVSPRLRMDRDSGRMPAPQPGLAPIAGPVSGQVCRKVNAAEIGHRGTPTLDYLPLLGQNGFVVRGWATLIAGYPKAGKTELLARLCHAWQGERILYVTEEPESIWAARLARMPDGWEYVTLLFGLGVEPDLLLAEIEVSDATVVVIDTVRKLLQLEDETDNSEVARVLTPYIATCRQRGKTLLLSHHVRKGGGHYGEGITGGHAFLGIVDAALELLREPNLGENRRRIRGWGRVAPIPELVYELDEGGTMTALGDPGLLAMEQVKERALEVLNGEWQKTRDILEALDEPRPGIRNLRDAMNALAAEGLAERDPREDRSGATYRYRLSQTEPGTALPMAPGEVSLAEAEQPYLALAEREPP